MYRRIFFVYIVDPFSLRIIRSCFGWLVESCLTEQLINWLLIIYYLYNCLISFLLRIRISSSFFMMICLVVLKTIQSYIVILICIAILHSYFIMWLEIFSKSLDFWRAFSCLVRAAYWCCRPDLIQCNCILLSGFR